MPCAQALLDHDRRLIVVHCKALAVRRCCCTTTGASPWCTARMWSARWRLPGGVIRCVTVLRRTEITNAELRGLRDVFTSSRLQLPRRHVHGCC